MNKKGLELTFAWLFAIIVGAVIIVLAIYATTSLIKTESKVQETEIGKQFGILLSPIETNLEAAKIARITFPDETRLINNCRLVGTFGAQDIGIATRSRIGEEWTEAGVPSTFYNKYMFSSETTQGREFSVFSKPFNMPFKVADLIFVWSEEYCFINPSTEILEELEALNPKNINITTSVAECSKQSKKVCFTSSGCDIDVSVSSKSVKKGKQVVYYEDSLIYGAIFADPDIYECQVKRLLKRSSELSLLYIAKSESLAPRGCSSNLESDLTTYAFETNNVTSSIEFREFYNLAKTMKEKNELLSCKLF